MPRVLVVDDSAVVRTALTSALEPYGVEIVHAENGAVAVERGVGSRWDLIFLDVTMPVMDGPTALRLLRARGVAAPVVLITSVSSSAVIASAVKLGSVDYISKPISIPQAQATARRHLALDTSVTRPQRVLLQFVSPELPSRMRGFFPPHVILDASSSLAESMELAERGAYALCVIETRGPLDEARAIASVLRRSLPHAALVGIAFDSPPGVRLPMDDELDAALPADFDDDMGRGLIYPCFVRPLVFVSGMTLQAVEFQGPLTYRSSYLDQLVKSLVASADDLEKTLDPVVDLRDFVDGIDASIALVARADEALRVHGAAPKFLLSPRMTAELPSRLPRVLLA